MTHSDHDRRVDYIEFGATDVGRTKQFYQQVFGWQFRITDRTTRASRMAV